ncbi:MAG: Smr/MutS family protein [Myxococcota bacterium]
MTPGPRKDAEGGEQDARNGARRESEPPARARPEERFADLVADARPLAPRGTDAARARRPARVAARPRDRRDPTREGAIRAEDAPPVAFRWPDPDEPRLAAGPGIPDALLQRLRRGEPEPEERIDLHGARVVAAKRLLAQRLASAQARGLRCVLLVHGRGRGSATNDAPLRDAVPDWLTRGGNARRVLALAPAPQRLGGEGATMVLLRKGAGA